MKNSAVALYPCSSKIHLVDWGVIDYRTAWDRQEKLFAGKIADKLAGKSVENDFILCEHPHVYTLGKHGNPDNLLVSTEQLQLHHATFVPTNRGGDITYHGPGQLVGYPIFDLDSIGLGLKDYINRIEQLIINLLEQYGIKSERMKGATGVWIDTANSRCRKIAAIGVRSSHFVTMHGFALNVNTDLRYFSAINPCGFTDKGVTSMQKELGHTVEFNEVKRRIMSEAQILFK